MPTELLFGLSECRELEGDAYCQIAEKQAMQGVPALQERLAHASSMIGATECRNTKRGRTHALQPLPLTATSST